MDVCRTRTAITNGLQLFEDEEGITNAVQNKDRERASFNSIYTSSTRLSTLDSFVPGKTLSTGGEQTQVSINDQE